MATSSASRLLKSYLNYGTSCHRLSMLRIVKPELPVNRKCYCDDAYTGVQFNNPEVQRILRKITGLNLEKVFRPQKTSLTPPTYSLISEQKLKTLKEKARDDAEELLQMPPVMEEREEIDDVLSEDKTLEGLETAKLVFTDITYGLNERKRLVVVRDPSGTLRKATWDERDRMMQIYFPRPNRHIQPPPLFDNENLQHVLDQGRYEYLLDACCVQFEPDNADFIRVHRRAYNHINEHHHYDLLRSTRHFGGMVFYLARKRHVEGLMADMLERSLLGDAVDLIRLYHMIHPNCRSATESVDGLDELHIVKTFVALDAKNKGKLELLIQQYEAGAQSSEAQQ